MTNSIENKDAPDFVSPPGETIAEILREREIPLRIFSNRMEMSRKETSRLMEGKIEITTRIACRLEYAFGVPTAHFWKERERLYRESLVKQID